MLAYVLGAKHANCASIHGFICMWASVDNQACFFMYGWGCWNACVDAAWCMLTRGVACMLVYKQVYECTGPFLGQVHASSSRDSTPCTTVLQVRGEAKLPNSVPAPGSYLESAPTDLQGANSPPRCCPQARRDSLSFLPLWGQGWVQGAGMGNSCVPAAPHPARHTRKGPPASHTCRML